MNADPNCRYGMHIDIQAHTMNELRNELRDVVVQSDEPDAQSGGTPLSQWDITKPERPHHLHRY